MDLVIFKTYAEFLTWLDSGEMPNKTLVVTDDGYCIFATNNISGEYKTYTLHL